MTKASALVERAAQRGRSRRARFATSPAWISEPCDLLATAAFDAPHRLALVERERRVTYGELDRAASAAASQLASAGARPGKPVLLVVQNDVASVVALHGALRLGALLLVAPTSAGPTQLADIAEQAAPAVLVAPDAMIANGDLPAVPGRDWRPLDALGTDSDAPAIERTGRGADEPAVVLFTSGTTSRPKGVIHSISTLLAATFNYIEQAAMTSEDRFFVVSPLASITGIMQCLTTPCILRAAVVLERKWNPVATCDLLLDTRGTFFGGPDLLLDRLLDEVEARGLSSTTLRIVYLGGAALNPRILTRVEDNFGIVVLRAYGSSEAPCSTAGNLRESREQRLADDGAPLAGVEVRRGSGNDPTELCITGPHLFLGYLDEADDAHAFEIDDDGREWFCTGDVAELRAGRVKIVGRIRDIAIRNGLKVPISEVEAYMNALPGIARAAGFAVTDDATGERLVVAVIPQDGARIGFDSVVGALSTAGLAIWKLPEELVLWDEPFPENATGKILRKDLEKRSAGRPRMLAPRLQEVER